jgi:uncharacterized membrane protein
MSDQETPQDPGAPSEKSTAPPEPSPATDRGAAESPNRNLMIVLAYIWILFLIPLLIEKDDKEVQWHAKNGLVLSVAEFILQMVLSVTGIGCFFAPFVFLGFLVIRLLAIVKGLNGERFMVPVLSDYASKF